MENHWLIKLLNGELFQAIGTISSVISLVISVFVLYGIKKIKKFYLFAARSPQILTKLSELASSISDSLDSFDKMTTSIYKLLGETEINLKSLSKKVDGNINRKIKRLIRSINDIEKNNKIGMFSFLQPKQQTNEQKKQEIQDIYLSLHKIITECQEIHKDNEWRS